jgi:hypothetical protein
MGFGVDSTTSTGDGGSTGSDPNPSSGGGGGGTEEQPPLNQSGDGSIQQGSAPSSYDYQIVGQNAAVGGSYVAAQNSNITCNGSVAVFSRLCSFLITNTSSAILNACSSYVGNFGYAAAKASSIDIISSVASVHKFNYYAGSNSTIVTKFSQSVFPFDFSQYAAFNSSVTNLEFESMTRWWDDDTGANAVHFGSVASSYIQNQSSALANLNIPSGFSGGIVGTQPLRFVWSEIFKPPSPAATTSLGNPGYASYGFVPFAHSLDYINFVNSQTELGGSNIETRFPGLAAIITFRNNYQSVKPPPGMFKPEDGSGSTALGGANNNVTTNAYSLSTLISNGFSI